MWTIRKSGTTMRNAWAQTHKRWLRTAAEVTYNEVSYNTFAFRDRTDIGHPLV
jgi:hypothetical protein